MIQTDPLSNAASGLRSAEALHREGYTNRDISRLIAVRGLICVNRGWYVERSVWQAWYPDTQHLAHVLSAHRNAHAAPLFSHFSAAAILGLPVWHLDSGSAHTISTTSNRTTWPVIRHRLAVDEEDTMVREGIRCTTPERTLWDLASLASTETLIGCADSILRNRLSADRRIDPDLLREARTTMQERLESRPGMRGSRRLRRILQLADPRAESVLESASRLQLLRAGFDVELQVAVPAPEPGRFYFPDIKLLNLDAFVECDGKAKYRDPGLRGDRSLESVLLAEKRRSDWISGTTGCRIIRVGAEEASSFESMSATLRAHHVPFPHQGRFI